MFKRALILGAILVSGVVAVSLFGLGNSAPQPEPPTGAAEAPSLTHTKQDGVTRVDFLRGLEIDDTHALILHPMATGGGMRVVTDTDALKAAQNTAFYTDDPDEQTKMLFLSLLFLSPAGMPPDSQFATTLRNKEVVEHFRCYVPFCTGSYTADPPHQRDLAGLLEASLPAEQLTETSRNPEDIRAFHFKALSDDRIVQIDPPQLPPPNTVIFPNRMILNLPPVLLDTDADGQEPLIPFDQDEYTARFTAAFEHAYPQTEAYRLGEMQFSQYYTPAFGWPVVGDDIDGYLLNDAGELRGITQLMLMEPSISIQLTASMAADLLGPDAFADMPEFAREPDSLSDRLDTLAADVLGRPCPDCFKIELPVATVDAIKPREIQPIEYYLSYLKVIDE